MSRDLRAAFDALRLEAETAMTLRALRQVVIKLIMLVSLDEPKREEANRGKKTYR